MFKITIIIAKTIHFIINLLGLGSGYAWSGYVATGLDKDVLDKIAKILPKHIILISGTNGKTTTAKMISHILEKKGNRVLSNKTGGNLINGIVSTVLIASDLNGTVDTDIAVFEIDELALPIFIKHIKPEIIALLNLSRDQLDRYWEIDFVADRWKKAFDNLNNDTYFVLYKNQNEFETLNRKNFIYFDDLDGLLKKTKLAGRHNAQNLNCAVEVLKKFQISEQEAVSLLSDFDYAYGRGEEILYKNKVFRIYLAKNPASFNSNLNLLLESNNDYDSLLFILNDNIPDGRDVSWIYDIDPKPLNNCTKNKIVYVSGIRAYDMAIRLKYAGIQNIRIFENPKDALADIVSDNNCKNIVSLPNYSSMLNLRKLIKGRSIL